MFVESEGEGHECHERIELHDAQGKANFALEEAMKAQRESTDTALLFL
jgi:hypothetical protein